MGFLQWVATGNLQGTTSLFPWNMRLPGYLQFFFQSNSSGDGNCDIYHEHVHPMFIDVSGTLYLMKYPMKKNQPSSAFMHLNAMFQGIPLFWRVQTPIIGAGTQFGQAIGRFGYNLEPQAARYKHSFHQGVTRHRSIWTAQWARLDIYLHVSYNHKSKQYQKQLYHIYSIQWKLPNVHVCIYAYMQSWMKGWINGWMY